MTLDKILKGTSRAFYLSLSILPPLARTPLSLAYLLARAADTIADAPCEVPDQRRQLLSALRLSVASGDEARWGAVAGLVGNVRPDNASESQLLQRLPLLLQLLESRPKAEQKAIRGVVSTLIEGMLFDQELFESTTPVSPTSGLEDAQLETYTYLVAGCVGPFWSQICALSDPCLQPLCAAEQHETAVEFGKGLQWVNILRDVPKDQSAGRYYLPALGAPQFLGRYLGRVRRALAALSTAQAYPLLFPRGYLRHRLAVFWPLVLALRTLELLASDGGPRPGRRVKVARWEVMVWVGLGPLLVSSDAVLVWMLKTLRRRAEQAVNVLEEKR